MTDNHFVDLFSKKDSFYEITNVQELPAYYIGDSELVLEFRFMMSLDELNHSRIVYNLLDYLGDVGGCFDALKYLGTILVWVFTGDGLSNFLASRFF